MVKAVIDVKIGLSTARSLVRLGSYHFPTIMGTAGLVRLLGCTASCLLMAIARNLGTNIDVELDRLRHSPAQMLWSESCVQGVTKEE